MSPDDSKSTRLLRMNIYQILSTKTVYKYSNVTCVTINIGIYT